jgi:hypothetical protein
MRSLHEHARICLEAAKSRQKHLADKGLRDTEFQVGDEVLLKTTHLHILHGPSARKLWPRWVGPFEVLSRHGASAYRLKLPVGWRIHDVFNISLLKPYNSGGKPKPAPPAIMVQGVPEFVVERILDHVDELESHRWQRRYLVRWQGYNADGDTWEPAANVDKCEAVDSYWAALGGEKRLPRNPRRRRTKAVPV